MTGEQIAAELEIACAEGAAFIRDQAPAHWGQVVPGEEWPVGVVARHIASGSGLFTRWVEQVLAGGPVGTSRADIDAANAAEARRPPTDPATVERELLAGAGQLAALIRVVPAEVLEREVVFAPANGALMTGEAICRVPARHVRTHLANMVAAVSA